MESRKDLSKYLKSMDVQNTELLDKSLINDGYSNFRLLGIGKETEAQKARRAKAQKAISDAKKNISQTTKDAFKSVKDKLDGGKGVHAANKINPVFITTRGALLGMLSANVFGTATNMYEIKRDKNQKYWNDIMQKFWMWGGEKNKIAEAVEKGKNKKPIGQSVMDKLIKQKYGIDGYYNAEGKGAQNAGITLGVTAALGGGTAAILATNPATAAAAPFVAGGSAALAAMSPIFMAYGRDKGAKEAELAPVVEAKTNPDNIPINVPADISIEDDTILGMPKVAFWIGVSAIVLVGGYFGYKKFIAKK